MAAIPVASKICHIDIQYCFIADVINHGEAQIIYCPTSNMVADFFTKSLQGSLFCKFCSGILSMDDKTEVTSMLPEQECVGGQETAPTELGEIQETQKPLEFCESQGTQDGQDLCQCCQVSTAG